MPVDSPSIIVIGGGAAGYFGAIQAASHGFPVKILERAGSPLRKVRISGGGRCNVTHACFEPRSLSQFYPRGGRELLGPFHRFGPTDTVRWFAERGVTLKTEDDGRMFPVTDQSATIIDTLQEALRKAGGQISLGQGVRSLAPAPDGGWEVVTGDGETLSATTVLVAVGSLETSALGDILVGLGHRLIDPVPSLFTFKVVHPLVGDLAGVSVPAATLSTPAHRGSQTGPVLFTHWGLSGPAVLRMSAWAARSLAACAYAFPLHVAWTPHGRETLRQMIETARQESPRRAVLNTPLADLPRRLWQALGQWAGIAPEMVWAQLPGAARERLLDMLTRQVLQVEGKSTHKEEFVTCGGIALREVNFSTMESKRCPGLYFAGECLDIDGVTGGFNFQAAWTTGYIAGEAMAGKCREIASGALLE